MKQNENGRSMIEMLGVLAIIGVLSVGGLAGYAKMMAQYRINATLQQVQVISSKLTTQAANGGSFQGLSNYTAYRLNALPSEIIDSIDDEQKTATLSNAYAGAVKIEASSITSGECGENSCDNQAYTITYAGLHQEACLALGGSTWNSSRNSSVIGIGVGKSDNEQTIKQNLKQDCTGTTGEGYAVACAGSASTISIPMDLDVVTSACNCGDGNCVLVLKFF